MCGIAGIVGRLDDANRAALRRMNDAMAHRGPDAEAVWESEPDAAGHGVLLAHRRLAILDLSPAGIQPMVDPVTRQVIVFNGEIYNYVELRDRLTAAGQQFGSSGDTAVMLRALALHGVDALPWLRGMFAFALFRPADRTLLLARDPLGMKPLYLARRRAPGGGWSFAFASELRALLASGLLGTPRLDPRAVASVVWNGFVVGPSTAVEGVDLLSPGHALTVDARGAPQPQPQSEIGFWSIPPAAPAPPLAEDELAHLLEEDVRLHLASDVPLAVFLSGGIDSSSVANLAQRAAKTPIHTFTLAFEEEELNEGPFARRIAQAIGTDHREVLLTEGRFAGELEAALDSIDQPTFDGVNSYVLSRAIREAGFTVALAGTGGDELFGGYQSFLQLPKLRRMARRARLLPRGLLVGAARAATALLRRSGGAIPPQTRWAKLPHFVARRDDLLALYQLAYALFLPEFQQALVGAAVTDALVDGLPKEMRTRLADETAGRSALSAIAVLDQRLFLGERLLRDNDVASMAASLEQRVPLVDSVLHAAVDRLPDGPRFDPVGRKALLRRVGLEGLDPAIFEKPKTGFVLPFDRWIRRGLKDKMDETLRDAAAARAAGLAPEPVARLWQAFLDGAPGVYWSRVWALYVHVRWCHKNRVFV
jgi:asparagine synthase (glutamine-hydrolysing)